MKARIFLILGLFLVALVSAVVHLPASVIVNLVKVPDNIRLQGVSGTIWHGEVNDLNVSAIALGKVIWKIEPSALLSGKLRANFRFGEQSSTQARGKGMLEVSASDVSVSHLSMSMPAQQLAPWIHSPLPLAMGGELSLFVANYQFAGNLYCEVLNGQLSWNQAKVAFLSNQLDFGNANASLGCAEQQIVVQTSQESEQLSSLFSLKLRAPNSYQLTGWFTPNDGFPVALRPQLKWLPAPDGQNRYQIKESGRY